MGTVSDDIRRLLEDCELFVSEILQDESLSKHARDTREILLNNFRVVYSRNPQEFPYKSDARQEDSSDDNQSSSLGRSVPSDDVSVASDYQDDGSPELFEEIPMVAAQDLSNILKQGYLEKKRRDHSFFGSEWQKRWCVLNNTIFYYFGSEKDKQQKGSFYINGYSAVMATHLRKDSKKNYCFELSAPGKRSFQFTASCQQEAREWIDQINFVLKGSNDCSRCPGMGSDPPSDLREVTDTSSFLSFYLQPKISCHLFQEIFKNLLNAIYLFIYLCIYIVTIFHRCEELFFFLTDRYLNIWNMNMYMSVLRCLLFLCLSLTKGFF
ncbi:src kinase-associated phosphoprotein 1 isoform X3 [Anguilla rostrata]|uniref:src kinase-associated phosphoprotein 1 isoform X3 n=1 Tax=Anguilla rostrata TaxID=7938 RepID=UPI0030CF7D0B